MRKLTDWIPFSEQLPREDQYIEVKMDIGNIAVTLGGLEDVDFNYLARSWRPLYTVEECLIMGMPSWAIDVSYLDGDS